MLVLSRRVGERLIIGDNIVITVIDVRSDGVRIGIDAPREVRVNRAEVLEAVKQANVEAAQSTDDDAALQTLRALRPAGAPDASPEAPARAPRPPTEPDAGTPRPGGRA
ncbi:MAG TPA: carbon storage regulator CsrA [Actinotalea sp.]|jgi:carbon storage regulator